MTLKYYWQFFRLILDPRPPFPCVIWWHWRDPPTPVWRIIWMTFIVYMYSEQSQNMHGGCAKRSQLPAQMLVKQKMTPFCTLTLHFTSIGWWNWPMFADHGSISTTCLSAVFMCADPKSTKRQSNHQSLFALLGSVFVAPRSVSCSSWWSPRSRCGCRRRWSSRCTASYHGSGRSSAARWWTSQPSRCLRHFCLKSWIRNCGKRNFEFQIKKT